MTPLQLTEEKAHRLPQNSFRILPIKVAFHFKVSLLATLQFKDIIKENKERKHLSGSGEIAKKKKDWRGNEWRGESHTRT